MTPAEMNEPTPTPTADADGGDAPPDVIVIGSGFAGSLAAHRAAESGARVLLVRQPRQATTLFSGMIDIGPAQEDFDVTAALTNLLVSNRHHPFQSLLRHAQGLKDLVEAVHATMRHLREALDAVGLEVGGGPGRTRLLTTPLGSTRTTFYALGTQTRGDLTGLQGADLLAVGFAGLWGFDAEAYATSLSRTGPARFRNGQVSSLEIPLPEGVRTMVDLAGPGEHLPKGQVESEGAAVDRRRVRVAAAVVEELRAAAAVPGAPGDAEDRGEVQVGGPRGSHAAHRRHQDARKNPEKKYMETEGLHGVSRFRCSSVAHSVHVALYRPHIFCAL